MAINTPLGDTLPGFLDSLLDGKSALSQWKAVDTSRIYCKVGADLSPYDIPAKVAAFDDRVPADVTRRLRRLTAKAPWSTRLTLLMALDAAVDAGLLDGGVDLVNTAAIVAGHNINLNYQYGNRLEFELRATSQEELHFEVRVPLSKKTDRLSDIILKIDPENATAVEWEERKEKK